MERRNFIKSVLWGGVGLMILPKEVLFEPRKDQFYIGLFYEGKEVSYSNYKRMPVNNGEWTFKKNEVRFNHRTREIVFPKLKPHEKIIVDSWGVFKNDEFLCGFGFFNNYTCYGGNFTMTWNENL